MVTVCPATRTYRCIRKAHVVTLARVGTFSYSMYVVHALAMRVINQPAHLARLPVGASLVVFLISVGSCVIARYLANIVFDRRFVLRAGTLSQTRT